MDQTGSGDASQVINFEELREEGSEPSTKKLEEAFGFLKTKLSPADYNELLAKFGVKKDLTNAELLQEFAKLLAKKKDDEDEEREKEEKLGYTDFMKKCMKEGKSMADCAAAYKKKYPTPEPKKEEVAEIEQLAQQMAKKEICPKCGKPKDECTCTGKGDKDKYPEYPPEVKKKMEELEASNTALLARMEKLEKDKGIIALGAKIDSLVTEKHITPKMKDQVIELAAVLEPAAQEKFLNMFRGIKVSVFEDVGRAGSGRPGELKGITPERRREILRKHNLDHLIEEKADKTRLSKEMKEAIA